ncbi:MAG: DEAD/DEAH box helicase, partial [Desulfonatronovibrio sp.]
VDSAPPMSGGEYLSVETLEHIWNQLVLWGNQTIALDGGLEKFLNTRAPKWNKVGRVTFHLAENKNDQHRPFAFMAVFSTGISAGGQVKHLPLRKALELYTGNRNKPALIKLLTPVNEASTRCKWVKEMVDSGDIYRPMAWSASKAYQLLKSAPDLEQSGLSLRLPDWWKKKPKPRVNAVIGETRKSNFGIKSMLDFQVKVALGDDYLSMEELEELLSGEDGLVMFKGQWVEVDRKRLNQAINHWKNLEKISENGQISFIEGMRMLAGAPKDLKDVPVEEDQMDWSQVVAGKAIQEMLDRLRNPAAMDQPDLSKDLKATLRPYQKEGTAWLNFLSQLGLGACLADDMGLGKTIQVLALLTLQSAHNQSEPSLLIIPASLLGNWRSEAKRFAPRLKLLFVHSSEMNKKDMQALERDPVQCLAGYDMVVTTYAMATRTPWILEQKWKLVILDEAQAIKNHSTNQSKTVRKLQASARIALTGTPIENRIGDMWSLFDFLNPGLLGSARQFKNFVKKMEEDPKKSFSPLRKIVSPYILRRLKTDKSIISDLPDKTETVQFCSLTRDQVKYYHQAVKTMEKTLNNKDELDDMARRGIVLQTLMRLKQICNHPAQFLGDNNYIPAMSGKFTRIAEICQELAQRQEKVLIFTQFREIIPALEDHLTQVFGRPGLHL